MRKRHNKPKPRGGPLWDFEFQNGTGDRWRRQCTGCRLLMDTQGCRCGRAALNRCVACGAKLWDKEGVKVFWAITPKEVCKECAAKMPPTALVEGAKSNMHTGP